MIQNFAIGGLYRSGTKFLAENMNRSAVWTVRHEGRVPGQKAPGQDLSVIKRRILRPFYGEVNYHLLRALPYIRAWRRGVILRSPLEAWLSITTKRAASTVRTPQAWEPIDFKSLVDLTPRMLDLAEKYRPLDFKRMTTDLDYLTDIFAYFGVEDVQVTPEMLATKVNANPPELRRRTLDEFRPAIRDKVLQLEDLYQKRTGRIDP